MALRAGDIIKRLREFVAKGETQQELENPAVLLEEAAALALVGAREQGVRVSLRCDHDLPSVIVDKIQVQQVALNLIRNAIEAMEATSRRELTVAAVRQGDLDWLTFVNTVFNVAMFGHDTALYDEAFKKYFGLDAPVREPGFPKI